jgi:aspartate carbamoyltransferase
MAKNWLYQQSYISVDQIKSRSQVEELFSIADVMKAKVLKREVYEPLKGRAVAILFYQPSTRTFTSFEAASRRLGAYTVAVHGMAQYSSVAKGETLEDTIKSIYQTTACDAIVIRHPDNNSSEVAKSVSAVPIINGGSGTAEHPTQALLDLYTIYDHFQTMDNLHVVMVGDLLYGRTTKSLAKLLAIVGKKVKITFVSPKELMSPREFVAKIKGKVKLAETDKLTSVLPSADVVYMTRVQKEWFEKAGKLEEYERLKDRFVLTRHMVSSMKPKAIVMHPLPRVGEILYEVDEDKRAKYFSQMRSGLYVRMAILKAILCP